MKQTTQKTLPKGYKAWKELELETIRPADLTEKIEERLTNRILLRDYLILIVQGFWEILMGFLKGIHVKSGTKSKTRRRK